jgi:hypothetical protein
MVVMEDVGTQLVHGGIISVIAMVTHTRIFVQPLLVVLVDVMNAHRTLYRKQEVGI